MNNIVKTSLCQRNAFGGVALAHNGTFGTMQVGALPNGVTDQLHQIGIALISQTISNNIELYKLV